MDPNAIHRETYDSLADEYEARVPALRPAIEKSVFYLAPYLKENGRVLDVGCGVGSAVQVLTGRGFQASGIDLSPKMAEFARRRNPKSEIIVGDFLTTNFSKPFNGIIALAFIHLFPKEKAIQVLQRMYGLLSSGGVVAIGTTESKDSKEGWEVKKDYAKKHQRFRKHWTMEELRLAVEEIGFKVLEPVKITDNLGKNWIGIIAKKAFRADSEIQHLTKGLIEKYNPALKELARR